MHEEKKNESRHIFREQNNLVECCCITHAAHSTVDREFKKNKKHTMKRKEKIK